MSKKNNTFKAVTIGIIIGSTIVGGGFSTYYLVSKYYKNNETIPEHKNNYTFIKTNIFDGGPTISEANVTDHKKQYWLGKTGLQKLKDKILKDLTYGPEIFQLKSIVIGDENFITEKSNGLYIPLTNEVFINTKNYRKIFPTYSTLDNDSLTNMKVEMLFPVIFHEYYHHLANSYLINAPLKSTSSSKEIYSSEKEGDDETEKRDSVPWNKDFISSFKKNLRYDTDTKKVNADYITFPEDKSYYEEKKYKSLGSIYNQKDLFEITNGKAKPNFFKLNKHIFFDGYILGYDHPYYKIKASSESLKYYYSMSELFVRKYQQLIEPYFYDDKYSLKMGHGIIRIPGDDSREWGTLSSELLYNRNHYESLSFNKKNIEFKRFLQDAPFSKDGTKNERSKALFENLDKHFGHSLGDDISFLWSKNDSKLISNDRSTVYNDDKEIKFGGYLKNNNENYKYVGYKNEDGKFIGFPISIHDFTYRSKKTLESNEYEKLNPEKENKFYVLENWVEVSEIENKQLFFSKNKKGMVNVLDRNGKTIQKDVTAALVSARNSDETGYASTWSSKINKYLPETTYYSAKKINDKIMIGEKIW